MRFYTSYILLILVSVCLLTGCQEKDGETSEGAEVTVHELRDYDNLKTNRDLLLGRPVGLKFENESRHLFIQDIARSGVIEIDDSSNVINVYGKEGSGPGEIQMLADFFITQEHLFIVDTSRFLIHKYSRRDGQHISSLDYGEFLTEERNISTNGPPPPPKPVLIDNNNEPFVTQNETILLPSQTNGEFLYQAINWSGEKLADIGELPANCTDTEDNDEIRSALENRNVSARDLCLVFPVHDRFNPDEIFLVYSAIPKIAKYSLSGEKIWERGIPHTPEVDSLMIDLSNIVKSQPNSPGVLLLPARKYITGRSSPDGDLYLTTYTNIQVSNSNRPVWIHQFDSEGNLVNRYKIISDDDFWYYPGIDFNKRRIFIPFVQDSGIRSYYF